MKFILCTACLVLSLRCNLIAQVDSLYYTRDPLDSLQNHGPQFRDNLDTEQTFGYVVALLWFSQGGTTESWLSHI